MLAPPVLAEGIRVYWIGVVKGLIINKIENSRMTFPSFYISLPF